MNILMKSIWTAILDNLRDYKVLVLLLIFPLILILILGNALSGFFEPSSIKKSSIIYTKATSLDVQSAAFIKAFEDFISSEYFKRYFDVEYADSKEEGLNRLKKSKASALVEIKSSSAFAKKRNFIAINLISKEASVESSILTSLLQTFVDYSKLYFLMATGNLSNPKFNLDKNPNFIIKVNTLKEGQYPRAIDYYAITMLVMTVIYSIFTGIYVIEIESSQKTFVRLLCSPANLNVVLFGKAVGGFVFVYLESILVIVFSKIFFNVNWGQNLLLIFFIIFIYQLVIFVAGILLRAITKNMAALNAVIYTFATIATFIVGGYVRFSTSSEILIKFRSILPNYIAQTLLFTAIYDPSSKAYINLGLFQLCFLAAILLILSVFLVGRRKRWLFSN